MALYRVGLMAPGKRFNEHHLRGDESHFCFVKPDLLFGLSGLLRSEPVCVQLVNEGGSLDLHAVDSRVG